MELHWSSNFWRKTKRTQNLPWQRSRNTFSNCFDYFFAGLPCDPPASPSGSRWVRQVNARQADENSSRGNAILGGRKETEARRDQNKRQGVYHHHPQRHAHSRPASAVCRSGERSAEGLLALRVFATRLRVPAAVLGGHLRPVEGCRRPGLHLTNLFFRETVTEKARTFWKIKYEQTI